MFGHCGVNDFSKVECDGDGSCPKANIIIYWDNICGGPHWPWPNSHPSLCRNTFWKKEPIFNFLDTLDIRIGGRCSFPTNWSFFQFCFSPLLPRTCLRQKVAKKTTRPQLILNSPLFILTKIWVLTFGICQNNHPFISFITSGQICAFVQTACVHNSTIQMSSSQSLAGSIHGRFCISARYRITIYLGWHNLWNSGQGRHFKVVI